MWLSLDLLVVREHRGGGVFFCASKLEGGLRVDTSAPGLSPGLRPPPRPRFFVFFAHGRPLPGAFCWALSLPGAPRERAASCLSSRVVGPQAST